MVPRAVYLSRLEEKKEQMLQDLVRWADINTGSHNRSGLAALEPALIEALGPVADSVESLFLNPTLGRALRFRKRTEAPLQVFLGIHYDTVFEKDHPFQRCERKDHRLNGPGVVDAKAGLVILIQALAAFEISHPNPRLGWEVLLNPDEELGSPGSAPFLAEAARRSHLGLLFEPTLPDGALVDARKGSGNFEAVVRGRSAHAGRNPETGRNAITHLAALIRELDGLNGSRPGLSLNVGTVQGGGKLNVVPDLARCGFNVRIEHRADMDYVQERLDQLLKSSNEPEGFSLEIEGGFSSLPKEITEGTEALKAIVESAAASLGQPIAWTRSGGVCDGNKLAAAGLPVIDTLGGIGGGLHSEAEYLDIPSLLAKAQLAATILHHLADNPADTSLFIERKPAYA